MYESYLEVCVCFVVQPSMKEEMEQVVPAISKNPFLKNDQKHLGKMKSLLPLFKAREPKDEKLEEHVEEREHSVQRDCLKQELDKVLKGIRGIVDDGKIKQL